MNPCEMVREFFNRYHQRVPLGPTMPTPDVLYNRHTMLWEESKEIAEASTREELFDGILDALYVVYGTAVSAGITDDQIRTGFAEVHRSNLTKLWPDHLVDTRPKNTTATRTKEGWIVKRADGKVVKSPLYSPPNLKEALHV